MTDKKNDGAGNDSNNPHIRPEDTQKFDQTGAFLGDVLPPLWRRIYDNCIEQEFTETDSLKLVQTYILSQNMYGIRGSDG